MPTRWHFGDVVSKLMKTHDPPLDNSQLAVGSGLNLNTIGNLINGRFSPTPDTQNKVAAALGTTREDILKEVDRLNSAENILPMRSGHDRDYDGDPVLKEAMDYGRRIGRLEPIARVSIYSFVAALEQAQERVKRLEQQLEQAFERNRKP